MRIVKTTKFLKFEEVEVSLIKNQTLTGEPIRNFRIWNKHDQHLGYINYYHDWDKYVFTAVNDRMMFDSQCLKDIATFLNGYNF